MSIIQRVGERLRHVGEELQGKYEKEEKESKSDEQVHRAKITGC